MTVQTEREPQTVGELIRFWRTQRRLTQMELALEANRSTKHLSFVETGRSRPSSELLVHLVQHLDLHRSLSATACCSRGASLRPT